MKNKMNMFVQILKVEKLWVIKSVLICCFFIFTVFSRESANAQTTHILFNVNVTSLPAVTTGNVTNITGIGAISGGIIATSGGEPVTLRGVCWSTAINPTIADSHTADGNGTGSFSSNLTSLSPYTTYYIRAYATNCVGTGYGNQISFTTQAMTDINEKETWDSSIKTFPNPVSDELIIEANGYEGIINFEIYNSIGAIIFKGNLLHQTSINTGDFASGIYMLKLDDGKSLEVKKIIKE